MFDLTTPQGVQAYLEKTPFAASNVVTLAGGYANFTYRITLREPYTAPGLNTPVKTLVLKHAEPHVVAWKDIKFSVERQEFECLAFTLVPEFVEPSSIVGLPTLYHQDREYSAMLMTDGGPESNTLKAVLQSGPLPDDVARNIGTELGMFIARLHAATRNPAPGTPAHTAKMAFEKNVQARTILASYYFDQIIPTLTNDPPRLSPPIDLSPDKLAKLEAYANKSAERVLNSSDILNMGDFWTGNMVVVLDPVPHVMVIDWEAVRPGFSAMDVGQFLAELHLLGVFHPKSRASVDILVAAFTAAYRAVVLQDGDRADAEQRLAETAHDSAARLGTHLVTLTPQIPWGGPELTRETVLEGVEHILRSLDGDEAWLRSSVVGGLWG